MFSNVKFQIQDKWKKIDKFKYRCPSSQNIKLDDKPESFKKGGETSNFNQQKTQARTRSTFNSITMKKCVFLRFLVQ